MRSNNISDSGLRTVESSLVRAVVLHVLDLRGNLVSQQAAVTLSQNLQSRGASLRIRFPDLDSSNDHMYGSCVIALYSIL